MYVCPTSAHRGFRYGYRQCKNNIFTLETASLGRQNVIIVLLNIKKSTFTLFPLLKRSYYQWFFAHDNPPDLSTMLTCAGCFYRYMAIRITFIKIYSTLQKLVQLLTQALIGATRPAFFQQPRPAFIGNKSKGSQTGVFLALSVSLNLVCEHCIFPDARDASPPLEIGIPLTHYFILHRPTLWWCQIIGRDSFRNRQHSHWA